MADENPMGRAPRVPTTPASEDREIELSVLTFLLEGHPDHQLTIREVSLALNAGPTDFHREDAIERAIRELVGAGLLHCRCGFVLPTRAALYYRQLAA